MLVAHFLLHSLQQVKTMHLIYCELPLPRVNHIAPVASNENNLSRATFSMAYAVAANSNVRLMRRPKESDNTRFVLSGKLSDVCAALDQLAAQETRNTWRCAF